MDVEQLAGGVDRLNLGDAPEAGALAAAVATAAVGATSSPASESGFSKAADVNPSSNQDGTQMDSLRGGPSGPGGPGPIAHDKDNDVEGKLFIGGISWQTTEEGLRYCTVVVCTTRNTNGGRHRYGHPWCRIVSYSSRGANVIF